MVDKVTCAKCTWVGGYEKCSRLLSSLDLESSRHLPILVSLRGPYGPFKAFSEPKQFVFFNTSNGKRFRIFV